MITRNKLHEYILCTFVVYKLTDRFSMRRKQYYLSQAVWLSPYCSISVWCRTQDINMQLPSLPGFDNNSCKCQPDHYCVSSIPESLDNVSSPTGILYTSISVSAIHFLFLFVLFCVYLCRRCCWWWADLTPPTLFVILLILYPAFSHVGSSFLSAQLTVGHVVMRERERG